MERNETACGEDQKLGTHSMGGVAANLGTHRIWGPGLRNLGPWIRYMAYKYIYIYAVQFTRYIR